MSFCNACNNAGCDLCIQTFNPTKRVYPPSDARMSDRKPPADECETRFQELLGRYTDPIEYASDLDIFRDGWNAATARERERAAKWVVENIDDYIETCAEFEVRRNALAAAIREGK